MRPSPTTTSVVAVRVLLDDRGSMITVRDLPDGPPGTPRTWPGTPPASGLPLAAGVDEMTRRRSDLPPGDHPPSRLPPSVLLTGDRPAGGAVVVGLVAARGGAGASTLAAALAAAAVRAGRRTVLVDGRHTGAGVDVLLGVEEEPGLRWADLSEARGEVDPDRLVDLLPQWSGARVLSTDRVRALARPDDVEPDVLRALVQVCDLVVLDLPADRLALRGETCHALVVVARCDTLSVAGAQSIGTRLDGAGSPATGIVCRGPAVGRLLPHDVASAAGLELWGELVTDRSLEAAVEAGAGPVVRLPPRRGDRRGRSAAATSLGGVAAALDAHVHALAAARLTVR